MLSQAARQWIVFNLLRFEAYRDGLPWPIEPEDILGMWLELDADDARILYHLRNALPVGGPVPLPTWLSFTVEAPGWRQPVALVVTERGQVHRLEEAELVATARELLAADDPPSLPGDATTAPVYARPAPIHAPEAQQYASAPASHSPQRRPDAPAARPSPAPRSKAKAPAPQQFSLF